MQSAWKGNCSKLNTGRSNRNFGLPTGCTRYNLFWTAKGRGYSTFFNVGNGDGVPIRPDIINVGKVEQFNVFMESSVGSNTHSSKVKNGVSLKKVNVSLYHKMFNEEYYKKAYEALTGNNLSTTPGSDKEILGGFLIKKIRQIIQSMKDRSFRFKPSRKIEIPTFNGKMRVIGIPSSVDKITLEVLKTILEEIYEPIFLNTSHGFRPNRGTHTALKEIKT